MTYPTHLSQLQLPNLNSHCHFLSDHISQVSHSSLCNCALETWWKVEIMWQAQGKLDLFELHNPWGLLETNHICLKDGTKKVQAGNIVEHLHSSPWTSINLLYSRQRQGQQNGQANLGARTCGFIFNGWRVHIAKALDSLCQRRTILRAVGPFGGSMVVARRHSWSPWCSYVTDCMTAAAILEGRMPCINPYDSLGPSNHIIALVKCHSRLQVIQFQFILVKL